MAKWTLIEIVSDIVSAMSGDYIESIDDTVEAEQVTQIVKSTYQAMLSNRNWPHTLRVVRLTPFTDNLLPTHMRIEDEIKELVSVYYDVRRWGQTQIQYRPVKYLQPDDFLRYTNKRNSDSLSTSVITDPSGVTLLLTNNAGPTYLTSFDDTTLVFDAWDNSVETTLQASKTQARGFVIPEFRVENTFVPDLPEEAFSALIEEAKSRAMFELKQTQDVKAEQEAGRQQRWLSRKAWRVAGGVDYPNYGRRRGRYRDPTFKTGR